MIPIAVTPDNYVEAEIDITFTSIVKDAKYVNSLQDQIVITLPKGVTAKEYKPREWDQESLEALRAKYQEEAKALPNLNAISGAHGTIAPHMQRHGVSVALGLQPPEHAMYVYRDYGLKGSECYVATHLHQPGLQGKGLFLVHHVRRGQVHSRREVDAEQSRDQGQPGWDIHDLLRTGKRLRQTGDWLNTPGNNWYLGIRIYRPVDSILKNGYEPAKPTLVKR